MTKKVYIKSFGCQMGKLLHSNYTLAQGVVRQGLTVINIMNYGNQQR